MNTRSAAIAGSWISAALLAGGALLASAAPVGAAPDALPGARTVEEAKVELGRRLFFDPVASRSGARACASCHDPEHGFSDPTPRSDDDISRTRRHSQTLLDAHLNPTAHWDGEFDSIEELVIARLGRPNGVKGVTSLSAHSSAFGNTTGSTPGSRGGGGYGQSPQPTTPPSEPKDPPPPPTEPDDADPDNDDPPTTPTEKDPNAGKDGGAKDGKDSSAKDGAGKDDAKDKDKEAKDEPRSRATARAKAPTRVLPLDLTRLPEVAETIQDSGRYAEAFQAAFGSRTVTTAKLAEAIAAYCRTIRSTEAAFDRYHAGDKEALSAAARRGMTLFKGKAGCVRCHTISGQHPTFTDYEFHNTGVAWRTLQRGVMPGDPEVDADETPLSDKGREGISTQLRDRRAFKTATLRDLPRRGPYMHDGAFESLTDVVRYYARGASNDARQDPLIKPFEAGDQDIADLVAFLEALNGEQRPGLAPRPWHVRAERTRVRLVDARQQALAGLRLSLVPEGDDLPIDGRLVKALDVVTDKDGWVEYVPGCATHMRLALPDGLQPVGGALVPDSCARAVVQVPVDGRVSLVVAFEPGAPAPERLVAEHEGTMRLPGHPAPRTVFDRVSSRDLDGRQVASYEGWRRTDVPPEVIVRIPGDKRARPEHRLVLKDDRTLKLDLGT